MIFKQNVHTNCKMSTITKCEYGVCDSKHDIAYFLRQKEMMEFVSVEGVIENTISLTS